MSNNFQSKLGDGLSKISGGIEQGKQKLAIAQEISKLNKILGESSLDKTKVLIELGQVTYRKLREGSLSDEELLSISQSITELDKKQFVTMKKINELNQQNHQSDNGCTSCGTVNSAGDKFCGGCGSKLDVEVAVTVEKVPCTHCEEHVAVNATFCNCCGHKMSNVM